MTEKTPANLTNLTQAECENAIGNIQMWIDARVRVFAKMGGSLAKPPEFGDLAKAVNDLQIIGMILQGLLRNKPAPSIVMPPKMGLKS